MDSALHIDNQTKIESVLPIVLEGTRGYSEWVMVRVRTDQGIEGIGEGFTWGGQAAAIRSRIEMIGQQIKMIGLRIQGQSPAYFTLLPILFVITVSAECFNEIGSQEPADAVDVGGFATPAIACHADDDR